MSIAARFLLLCTAVLALPAIAVADLPPPPPGPPPGPPPSQISHIPAGKADNLIVWVHGCCTNKSDVDNLTDRLSDAYAALLQQSSEWEIVVWDWSAHTPKWDWDAAYNYAQMKGGSELAAAINQYPNRYTHIHLIGHSAGANLIHEASQILAVGLAGTPFIHLTFLDAYTPDDSAKQKYGRFQITYPHYAEHYVDTQGLLHTDEFLPNAFNFDITHWVHSSDQGDPFGHLWPFNWYIMSIKPQALQFIYLKYGHPLSGEVGNQLIDVMGQLYPPGKRITIDTDIPLRGGPEVTNVTFPSSIPADGERATGTVTFRDTIENNTGVNLAQFDVLGKPVADPLHPFTSTRTTPTRASVVFQAVRLLFG